MMRAFEVGGDGIGVRVNEGLCRSDEAGAACGAWTVLDSRFRGNDG